MQYKLVAADWARWPGSVVLNGRYLVLQEVDVGEAEFYDPLRDPALCRSFMDLETPKGALEWANRHGLLGLHPLPVDETGRLFTFGPEPVSVWLSEAVAMRDAEDRARGRKTSRLLRAASPDELRGLQVWGGFNEINQRLRDIRWRYYPDGPRAEAFNLLTALWLQLGEVITGNQQFDRCDRCGKWMVLDPDHSRTNRDFCSDTCRVNAYRARKRRAQELAAGGASVAAIVRDLSAGRKNPIDASSVRRWIKEGIK